MKKTITLSLIAIALALVSCHQPTKEEQQDKEVKSALKEYMNKEYGEDVRYIIDSIVYDTAGNTERYGITTAKCIETLGEMQYLCTPLMLAKFRDAAAVLDDEDDTTMNVIACVYVKFSGSDIQFVLYSGVRHGITHPFHLLAHKALKDIHTHKEQCLYDASEEFMMTLRAAAVIVSGKNPEDMVDSEDIYNIWVGKDWRISANRLDANQ